MSRRIGSASPAVVLQAEKDIKSRLRGQHFDFTAMSAVSNVYAPARRCAITWRGRSWPNTTSAGSPSRSSDSVDLDTQETGHVADEAGVTKGTLTGVIKTFRVAS